LGCLRGRKKYTLGGSIMHSTKLLEARPRTRKTIMNDIVPHRKQICMLDLKATDPTLNKENLPPILDPQIKRSSP